MTQYCVQDEFGQRLALNSLFFFWKKSNKSIQMTHVCVHLKLFRRLLHNYQPFVVAAECNGYVYSLHMFMCMCTVRCI